MELDQSFASSCRRALRPALPVCLPSQFVKQRMKEFVTKLGRPSGVCVVAALSPLRDCVTSHSLPTACAVGCILAPLRGYLLSLYPTFRMPSQLLHRLLRDLEDFFHSSQRRDQIA